MTISPKPRALQVENDSAATLSLLLNQSTQPQPTPDKDSGSALWEVTQTINAPNGSNHATTSSQDHRGILRTVNCIWNHRLMDRSEFSII